MSTKNSFSTLFEIDYARFENGNFPIRIFNRRSGAWLLGTFISLPKKDNGWWLRLSPSYHAFLYGVMDPEGPKEPLCGEINRITGTQQRPNDQPFRLESPQMVTVPDQPDDVLIIRSGDLSIMISSRMQDIREMQIVEWLAGNT